MLPSRNDFNIDAEAWLSSNVLRTVKRE